MPSQATCLSMPSIKTTDKEIFWFIDAAMTTSFQNVT
jgi:hypothetical protein